LLPNYNKCKNSDTLAHRHRDGVQQNGFQTTAAGGHASCVAGVYGHFVYMNDFS